MAPPEAGSSGPEEDHVPRPPERATRPCARFFRDLYALIDFMGFISRLALGADEATKIASEALRDTADDESTRERHQAAFDQGGRAVKKLRAHKELLLQLLSARATDNFLGYVSELMSLIFRTRPETLRSSEQVRLDVILQYSAMDELIDHLAEERVNALSYQGMRRLADHLRDRLGFQLFVDDTHLDRAVLVVEIRNLVVHKRAVIDRAFLSRVPAYLGTVGDTIALDVDGVFSDFKFLATRVRDIDVRAQEKFNLDAEVAGPDIQEASEREQGSTR
jgi:hypothetical protein